MGSDLSVANAARASFAKRSYEFNEADARLVRFLSKEDHSSPFRHAFLTFEIKAPLMVARQWWKYVVGSDHTMDGWNEASRRYVTMEPEFYRPRHHAWRSAPENKKQGSGGPVDSIIGGGLSDSLNEVLDFCMERYQQAINSGVAVEQARLFLPAYGMYTNWWWSCSLQSCLHFVKQRVADDAQKEIQEYALVIRDLAEKVFPVTFETILEMENVN